MRKLNCYFSHNVEIKGVYFNKLILDGWCVDEEDDNSDDIWGIVVDIKGYQQGMNKWIEEKKSYCERYNYNCGQGVIMGVCDGEEIELGGKKYIDCTNVEWEVDLEHG